MSRRRTPPDPFRWFDSSPEVIRLVVRLYVRYPLSLRNVEDLAHNGGAKGASYVAAFLLGGVIGAEVDFIAFLTRRHFAAAVFGRLYGLGFGIYMVGAGTGPLLMGASFDSFGGYRVALSLFAILGVAAAAVSLALPNHTRMRAA